MRKISRLQQKCQTSPDSANLVLTGDVSVELEKTLIEGLKKGVPLQFNQILEYLNSLFQREKLF